MVLAGGVAAGARRPGGFCVEGCALGGRVSVRWALGVLGVLGGLGAGCSGLAGCSGWLGTGWAGLHAGWAGWTARWAAARWAAGLGYSGRAARWVGRGGPGRAAR